MAKTSKKSAPQNATRQAANDAWTPDLLRNALHRGGDNSRISALKDAGIIDADGNLTPTYQNWGKKVTRTPNAHAVERPKV